MKYRYQTFTEAFSRAIIADVSLKPYNFRKSEDYQNELSKYIHVYYRTTEEVEFSTQFIQDGLALITKVTEFIKAYFVKKDEGYVFGIVNFSTLKGSFKDEFDKWLVEKSEDTESLYERLNDINNRENNGEKISF